MFKYLSRNVRVTILSYQLGVARLQDLVTGLLHAVALGKPHCRKVANGFASMLGVRCSALVVHARAHHRHLAAGSPSHALHPPRASCTQRAPAAPTAPL